jgi:hypothetical protein
MVTAAAVWFQFSKCPRHGGRENPGEVARVANRGTLRLAYGSPLDDSPRAEMPLVSRRCVGRQDGYEDEHLGGRSVDDEWVSAQRVGRRSMALPPSHIAGAGLMPWQRQVPSTVQTA